MLKVGDRVILRWCDCEANQEIIGKELKVVQDSHNQSPFWTEVQADGKEYTVRATDCRKI